LPDDELPDLPEPLKTWLYTSDRRLRRTAGDIATRLVAATTNVERHFYWMALGEAWAERCRPKGSQPDEVRNAVAALVAEVVPADEYTLIRYRRSEQLDLDHLSAPTPY
jgi:hypothetical protein